MGLKFQREDSLDKMFDEFAILPDNDKKENKPDIERFLNGFYDIWCCYSNRVRTPNIFL